MRDIEWRTHFAGWPIIPAQPFDGHPPPYVDIALTRAVVENNRTESERVYKVRIWYDLSERGLVIRAIESDDLTTPMLKGIGIGKLRDRISAELENHPERISPTALWGQLVADGAEDGTATATPEELERFHAAIAAAKEKTKSLTHGPGRGRGIKHDFYRDIALRYIDVLTTNPRNPIEVLASEYEVPKSKMSTWVRLAREYGWLASRHDYDEVTNRHLSQGQPYGGQGPRLKKWLEEQGDES